MRRGDPRQKHRLGCGVTLVEMMVVLGIMAVLVALIGVANWGIKSYPNAKRAMVDLHLIGMALRQYHKDVGAYPSAAFRAGGQATGAHSDSVLYEALTNPHAGGENRGWAGATQDWGFARSRNVKTYTVGGRTYRQIVDPWGHPYYYIANTDYLVGVRVHDPSDDTPPGRPNLFGATPTPDDYDPADRRRPPPQYYGPPPTRGVFHNPESFQIISKGPDGVTDTDACDRGTAPDDINNFGS